MSEERLPEDHWIPLSPDQAAYLFARRWLPGEAAADADAIVMLHDSLGSVELWRDFPERLSSATGRPVIAYDRLGFGRSSLVRDMPSHDFVAEEASTGFAAVCRAFDIKHCVVLGHSVGGGMALQCAAQAPDVVTALVTISAQAFVEEQTREGIRAAKARFADAAHFERLIRYHGERARWVLDAWTQTWLNPSFTGWSMEAALPRVHCPVLALHGMLDEYGSAAHPARIAQSAGGPVQVELLSGLGHMPHREEPDTVVRHIASFLAGLPSR